MIIAVELDNVISSPVSNFVALTDVEKCTVIPGAKEALVQIQAQGHSILIYTNREASLGPATEMWLQKNKIPYDKIVLNKPRYDIYIDTKCFTFDTWEAFTEAKKYRLQNS